MEVINGQWYMDGVDWDDESCLKSADDLLALIDEAGFMPLFANDIAGFSVENRTDPAYWWTGDPERDPWEWRMILARTGKVAYGKFFSNKAGVFSEYGHFSRQALQCLHFSIFFIFSAHSSVR